MGVSRRNGDQAKVKGRNMIKMVEQKAVAKSVDVVVYEKEKYLRW